jgi:hypothetical protein
MEKNANLHKKQIINLFKHFIWQSPKNTIHIQSVYLDKEERVKTFLDLVYTTMTIDEYAAIIS